MLKGYKEYKETDYDWLPQVPSHWKEKTIRSITKLSDKRCGSRTDLELLSVYREYGVIKKKSRDDNHNAESENLSNYKYVKKGNLVLNKMKMWQGSLGISEYNGIVSPAYIVCDLFTDANLRYLQFLLRSPLLKTFYNRVSYGIRVGQWDMHYDDFKSLCLYLPPRSEQDQIVRYLDWKVSMINKYINAKKKQIELLKEQKQAIINQAVTKGLDPKAPMKNSGIEWLGKIPAHWEVNKLRYFCQLQNGISESGDFFLTGTPFVSYSDVYKNYQLPLIVAGKASASKKQQEVYSVKEGDIFFTRTSETVEEIAYSSVCFKDIDKAVFSGFLIRARQKIKKLDLNYAKYFFRSVLLRYYFCREMNLVTRVSLAQTLLKDLPVLLPPMEDQKKIGEYLEDINSRLSNLIEKYQQEINKMDEYRTRLISDVVTGRVDVQGEKVPEFAVSENKDSPNIGQEIEGDFDDG